LRNTKLNRSAQIQLDTMLANLYFLHFADVCVFIARPFHVVIGVMLLK